MWLDSPGEAANHNCDNEKIFLTSVEINFRFVFFTLIKDVQITPASLNNRPMSGAVGPVCNDWTVVHLGQYVVTLKHNSN